MTKQILLIDDDARLAGMVGDYLGESDFDVTIAGTGNEGLALQKKHGFDAIILDLMLPDTDGLQVCRALRADGSVWTCPAKVPDTYLIYTATVSNARGLFPPSVECLRRGL